MEIPLEGFTIHEGYMVTGGIAVLTAVNTDTMEPTMLMTEMGDMPLSQRIGLLTLGLRISEQEFFGRMIEDE